MEGRKEHELVCGAGTVVDLVGSYLIYLWCAHKPLSTGHCTIPSNEALHYVLFHELSADGEGRGLIISDGAPDREV